MSTNRRSSLRKNRNANKDGNQSISNFTQKTLRDDCVEIIEEDDEKDQFSFTDQTPTTPLTLRRKKKQIVVDESDEEEDDSNEPEGKKDVDMDEQEKQQLEEAIRQSHLELERDTKRRENIYSMFEKSNFISDKEIPSTSKADTPSSPVSSGVEAQDRAVSPDLFSTPQSTNDNNKDDDIPDTSPSPKKVSSSTGSMSKSHFAKEINIKLTPIESTRPKRNLSLRKGKEHLEEETSEDIKSKKEKAHDKTTDSKKRKHTIEDDNDDDDFVKRKGKEVLEEEPSEDIKSKKEKAHDKATDSKKRKHTIEDDSDDDDFDGAKQHLTESIPVESRKKQRTIDHDFPVLSSKPQKERKVEEETKQFVIDDDDDEDLQNQNDNERRADSTSKLKKYFRVRLERTYKKPKLQIKSIRDAMKSRLFFAPPGIDHKRYTYGIIKMLDHTRECIRKAQQQSFQFVKWGLPIVAGQRVGDTLDAVKKSKRRSNLTESADEPFESKRSLRSSMQSKPSAATIKTEPETTNLQSETKNDSGDSDEELAKSVFGDKEENKPKNWRDYYNSMRSEGKTFGENINTSVSHNERGERKDNKSSGNKERNSGSEGKKPDASKQRKETPELDKKSDSIQQGHEKQNSETYSPKTISEENVNSTRSRQNSQTEDMADQSDAKSEEDQESTELQDDYQSSQKHDKTHEVEFDDIIDSSAEIGRKKKRHESKVPVVNEVDEEEVDSTCQEADVEMVDIDQYSSTDSDKDTKPGSSLTKTAIRSGFLKVKRNSKSPPAVQRKISTATKRAAEAAEKRLRHASTVTTSVSPERTSNVPPSMEEVPNNPNLVECPICYAHFPLDNIETHAAACNGTPPESNQEAHSSRGGLSDQQPSVSTSADTTVQQAQEIRLKNLKVLVTRSPEAQRILKEQRDLSNSKAKRSLSLTKHDKPTRSGHGEKVTGYIDMTCDQEDTLREDTPRGEEAAVETYQSEDGSQGNSQKFSWLTSTSAEKNKKLKFKVTYGTKKKTATSKNPFTTLDFIPLEERPPSSDSERDYATEKSSAKKSTNRAKNRTLKDTTAEEVHATPIPLSSGKAGTSCNAYADIDSDTEDESYTGYEATESKRNSKSTKSVHSSRTDKKKTKDDFDEEDHANEMALMELAGMSGKPSSDDNQSPPTKRRRKRATISSDDSDENDEYEKCFLCGRQVLKDNYRDHTESCVKKNPVTPGSSTGDGNTSRMSTRKLTKQTTQPTTSSDTFQMDSDEIGDSPIKSFKLIGEGDKSGVDFDNQFGFFKNKSDGNTSRMSTRKLNKQTTQPTTSSDTFQMDSDEIGDSPIKSFKLIGEGDKSGVDFDNQFGFFKNKSKSTQSFSKRGGKGARGRGRGRGFKNKRWYKKSYKK